MHKSQSFLFNLTTSLHVSDVTTTHPKEHKATASAESGNHYTITNFNLVYRYSLSVNLTLPITIGRVKFTDKEYR